MKRLAWPTAAAVLPWSLLAFGASALASASGGAAIAHADWATGHPGTAAWIAWAREVPHGASLAFMVAVWALGIAAISGAAAPTRSLPNCSRAGSAGTSAASWRHPTALLRKRRTVLSPAPRHLLR